MNKLSLNVVQMIDAENVILWEGNHYISVDASDYLLVILPENMVPMYVDYRFSWKNDDTFNVSLDPSEDLNLIKYTIKGLNTISDNKPRMFKTDIMEYDNSIISLQTILKYDGTLVNVRTVILQREKINNGVNMDDATGAE